MPYGDNYEGMQTLLPKNWANSHADVPHDPVQEARATTECRAEDGRRLPRRLDREGAGERAPRRVEVDPRDRGAPGPEGRRDGVAPRVRVEAAVLAAWVLVGNGPQRLRLSARG
jgi:hypothetical protein